MYFRHVLYGKCHQVSISPFQKTLRCHMNLYVHKPYTNILKTHAPVLLLSPFIILSRFHSDRITWSIFLNNREKQQTSVIASINKFNSCILYLICTSSFLPPPGASHSCLLYFPVTNLHSLCSAFPYFHKYLFQAASCGHLFKLALRQKALLGQTILLVTGCHRSELSSGL